MMQEFESFSFGKYEWLSLHLRYLVYYMTKYDIQNRECFTSATFFALKATFLELENSWHSLHG